jgi:hypothetical protein
MLKPADYYTALFQSITHAAVAIGQALGRLDEKQSESVMIFGVAAIVLIGTMIEGPFLRFLRPGMRAFIRLLIRAPELILNKVLAMIVEALIWFWLAILTGVSWLSGQ